MVKLKIPAIGGIWRLPPVLQPRVPKLIGARSHREDGTIPNTAMGSWTDEAGSSVGSCKRDYLNVHARRITHSKPDTTWISKLDAAGVCERECHQRLKVGRKAIPQDPRPRDRERNQLQSHKTSKILRGKLSRFGPEQRFSQTRPATITSPDHQSQLP